MHSIRSHYTLIQQISLQNHTPSKFVCIVCLSLKIPSAFFLLFLRSFFLKNILSYLADGFVWYSYSYCNIAMQSDMRQQSSPPAFIYVWMGIGWAIKREQKLMLFKFFFSTFSIHIGWIFLILFDLQLHSIALFCIALEIIPTSLLVPFSFIVSHYAHLKILFIICLSFTVDSNMQMQWQSKVGWVSIFIIQNCLLHFLFRFILLFSIHIWTVLMASLIYHPLWHEHFIICFKTTIHAWKLVICNAKSWNNNSDPFNLMPLDLN